MTSTNDLPIRIQVNNGQISLILDNELPAGEYILKNQFMGTLTHAQSNTGTSNITIQDSSTQESTNYGLNTDNPWTADNTQDAILPFDHTGWMATNYNKRSTGTIINIPLVGDFEIELKCNVNMNQGTGWFALYDGQSNIVEVNMNNTLNGSSINTVFPNPSDYMDTETFTLSRSGTTYTYKHGNETRTLTINNTNPLYVKMLKTGNGDMFISTMSIREIRGGA